VHAVLLESGIARSLVEFNIPRKTNPDDFGTDEMPARHPKRAGRIVDGRIMTEIRADHQS
jgi:hypothetical protein